MAHLIKEGNDGVFLRWKKIPAANFLLAEGPKPPDGGIHEHEMLRVSFLLKGEITEIDEFRRHQDRGPFTAHITPVKRPHAHIFRSERLATICFDVDPSFVQKLNLPSDLFATSMTIKKGSVQMLIPRFYREILNRDPSSEMILEGLMYEFIGEIVRRKSAKISTDAPEWLRQARELLQDAWRDNIGVEDVARTVGVHPSHLVRVFRQYTSLSPGEYLRKVRLDQATRMVMMSDQPLKTIAETCGFADQAHFSRSFKQHHGITPDQMRRNGR